MNENGNVVELTGVRKSFGNVSAVQEVSLHLERGQVMALLGGSGCGKTTTLRLIAGLEALDAGEVWLNNIRVAGDQFYVPTEKRNIGMVFQDFALFPHLTVAQNIEFAARAQHHYCVELMALVGLSALAERFPHQLSGGQQQRVALARALAPKPSVLLLDEPFSNLDTGLRRSVREDVRDILRQVNATAIFVTHDQEEAFSISDVIAVMHSGRIVQQGTPQQIYLNPATRQIAQFVGDVNFLPGIAHGQVVTCELGTLLLNTPAQGNVQTLVRPEQLEVQTSSGDNNVLGCIEHITYLGHDQLVRVRLLQANTCVNARTFAHANLQAGMRVSLQVRGKVMAYTDSTDGQ